MFWPGSYSIFFLLEEPFLYMKRCSKVSEDEEEDLLSFPPYIKRHKRIYEFINSNHSSLQYFSIPHGYREIADEAVAIHLKILLFQNLLLLLAQVLLEDVFR